MKAYTVLLTSLVLCATAANAQTQDFMPDFEVSLIGGYQFGGAMDESKKVQHEDVFGESLGIEGSGKLGAIVDYRLGPALLLELSYDRHDSKFNFHNQDQTVIMKVSDLMQHVYQAGLMYNWGGSGPVQPYIGGTIGLTNLVPKEDFSSELLIAGAPVFGIKTFASKHFALRFQSRLLVTYMPRSDDYFSSPSGQGHYNHTINSYMTQIDFSLGVTIGL